MKTNYRMKLLPVYIIMAITILFSILPFYLMLIMGTQSTVELFKGIRLLPGDYLIQNLNAVFAKKFLLYFGNSFYIALLVTFGQVLVSSLAGFGFAKYKFKYKNVLFFFVIGTLMIPNQLGFVGFMVEMRWFRMANSHLPLILPALASAFSVFWMTQYIKSTIPGEFLESARIDGCNDIMIFFKMVLPNITPGLVTVILLAFLASWNNYLLPLIIISKDKLFTLPLGIYMLDSIHRTDYGARILYLALTTIPILIIFSIGSKRFIAGLMTGSIKG